MLFFRFGHILREKICGFIEKMYLCSRKGGDYSMIIVPVKDGDSIEKALKKFKRKFEKTGAIRELRARREFVKPSIKRREQLKKAIYVQHLRLQEEQ